MARFKQIYRIIEDVADAIEWNIPITNIIDNGGGSYTLEVGCTAYLNECTVFEDSNSDKWEVTSFIFNESLTVVQKKHTNAWADTSIVLDIPIYLHGTVKTANIEAGFIMEQEKVTKSGTTPIIYLYETLEESVSLITKEAIERTANIRVFLITDNNFKDWIQEDYDGQIFDPLSNIEEKFIEGLLNNSNIGKFTNRYTRINHEQFGYTDRNGYLKRIFSGELSALELQLPLNINKCSNKINKCK